VSLEKSKARTLVLQLSLTFWISRAVALSLSIFLEMRMMLNPLFANSLAMALPIPSVLPVTTAHDSDPYLSVVTLVPNMILETAARVFQI
jgi:hypothetical protein